MSGRMGPALVALAVSPFLGSTSAQAQLSFDWVSSRTRVSSSELVSGGQEGSRVLYVCRSPHAGGQHPGKVVAGRCNFGYGGKEIQGRSYEVLRARGGSPRWSPLSGGLPRGAYQASVYDGRPGYVCRGSHAGGLHPGKVVAGRCNIGYGGKELRLSRYQVLLEPPRGPPPPPPGLSWQSPGTAGAVVAGREGSRNLVVCRGRHKSEWHPGKVVAGRCNIGYGGREILTTSYQVLVANGVSARWSPRQSGRDRSAWVASVYDRQNGYICRATYAGATHPGKVVKDKCNIGYGGREVVVATFESLLTPGARSSPPPQPVPQPAPTMSCSDVARRMPVAGGGRWTSESLYQLCNGGSGSEPAKCYERLMSGRVSWGQGTKWQLSNALSLCGGSSNGLGTISCFQRELSRRGNWRPAIDSCRRR